MLVPPDNLLFLQRLGAGVLFIVLMFFIVRENSPSNDVDSSNSITLYVVFKSADGIDVNSIVRLAGIRIGHVKEMYFSDQSRQAVTLKLNIDHEAIVNNAAPIPDDSTIRIISPGLISDKELLVEVGGSFDYLQNGDEFSYAQDSFILDDIVRYMVSSDNIKQ